MVGRLEGKPFVLISISTDEQKETLTKFLAKEKMPWTHWWNGNEGGILEDWGHPGISDDLRPRCQGCDPPPGLARREAGGSR